VGAILALFLSGQREGIWPSASVASAAWGIYTLTSGLAGAQRSVAVAVAVIAVGVLVDVVTQLLAKPGRRTIDRHVLEDCWPVLAPLLIVIPLMVGYVT
jgi:hypothetical protein